MAFLDNSGDIILDAVLTDAGRQRMARGDFKIVKFAKIFRKSKFKKPLVAVPSTYSKTSEKELVKNGFKIVI